jgi:hypothetical protein
MSYRDISINDYLPFTTEINKLLCEFAFGDFVIYGTHVGRGFEENMGQAVWFVPVYIHQLYVLHRVEHELSTPDNGRDYIIPHVYRGYEYIQLYAYDGVFLYTNKYSYGINKRIVTNETTSFLQYFDYYMSIGYTDRDYHNFPMFSLFHDIDPGLNPGIRNTYHHVNMKLLMCKRNNRVVYLGGIKNMSVNELKELKRAITDGRVYGSNISQSGQITLHPTEYIYRYTCFVEISDMSDEDEGTNGINGNFINDGSTGTVKLIVRSRKYTHNAFKIIKNYDYIELPAGEPHSKFNFEVAFKKALDEM